VGTADAVRREPAELVTRVEAYDAWLRTSEVPKLFLTFEGSPTLLVGEKLTAWREENIAALEVVPAGEAGHHAMEDRPVEIAAAIGVWATDHALAQFSHMAW
jgi:haloalkane dehalogenase